MNTSSSDFSSGCESGWTTYLNQSGSSSKTTRRRRGMSMKMMCGEYEEENWSKGYCGGEEDLSMVSDASSGPRQYQDEEEREGFGRSERNNSASEAQRKTKRNGKVRDRSQLDDTASSHSMNKQSSTYNNTANGHEGSAASLSKGKPIQKKYFGS
uniref:Uncharacterized protein n=1 Tax=Kalanchoe fedtschenkoi TaxID=63787 RepID=A0A7N0SXG9_KALFE